MIHRIGSKKPQYFAVMDMTSGYHQVSLHAADRKYSAFVTFMGVYEWTRIPMGCKGAPSYFQQMMAAVVLAGLVFMLCEVYIDDVIVHGKSADDFICNLRQIFEL